MSGLVEWFIFVVIVAAILFIMGRRQDELNREKKILQLALFDVVQAVVNEVPEDQRTEELNEAVRDGYNIYLEMK